MKFCPLISRAEVKGGMSVRHEVDMPDSGLEVRGPGKEKRRSQVPPFWGNCSVVRPETQLGTVPGLPESFERSDYFSDSPYP